MDLPTGTVTFLFTDVEGSTRLATALGAIRYGEVLDAHRRLLRDAFSNAGGVEVDTQGDSFFVAFRSAGDAVRAAVATQHALAEHAWPEGESVRVRIGIHTGEAAVADDGYRGLAVHRAARICASAHGGQVLLSATSHDVLESDLPADTGLRDLGFVQLRDIARPERLFQLVVSGLPEAFPPPRAPAPRQVAAQAADLLERDAELAALDALIASAVAGGRLVAIEGPAGIGKTRLLSEARRRAQTAGVRVLAARGSELEREFSYGVVRQLFEPLLASVPVDERANLLAGAAELATPIFDLARVGAEPDVDASLAMLHGLFWLTANVAERQAVVLAIDDLHWCDSPSLRWLAYLLPRLEGLPILIIVGLRPSEPGADFPLLAQLTTDPLATVVRPGALSEEATGELIGHVFPGGVEPAFRMALHEASGGNPLFVSELTNAVAAQGVAPTAANAPLLRDLGGQAVSRAVSLRLSHLSAEATSLAMAVAILGDDAELRHAAELAGLDETVASDAAADLGHVEILGRHLPLAFVHPVVRAAVYSELPAIERDRGHARAARLLAASTSDPERIAAQLLLARPAGDPWAVRTLRDAASNAVARGAPDSAVAYLRRALDEPPAEERADVLHDLGAAEVSVAAPEALEHLAAALAATTDVRTRARIALALGVARFSMGEPPKSAVIALQDGIRELAADDDPELALELETQLIGIARHDPDLHPLAAERLERLRATAPPLAAGQAVIHAILAGEAVRAGISRAEAVELAERALADGSLLRDHFESGFLFAVGALTAADRLDDAYRFHGDAIDDARNRGLVIQFCVASSVRSAVAFLRGALDDAVADAELCLAAIDSNRLEMLRPGAVAFLAQALIEGGDLARARQALQSATAAAANIESTIPLHTSFVDARARLRLAEGAYEQAFQALVERGRAWEGPEARNPALFAWRSQAALALLGLDRRDEARGYAAEELELSRRWGAPRSLGRSLIAAGIVEGGELGITMLREAVSVLETSQARLEHARAQVELGSALRRENHRSDSREPLRRGLELATSCGAVPLAERAETELLATGARPRRIALSGIESLTPSERRVAKLAAEGKTNREIAQALFVTPKTVEVHLSSVYRKLEISSRRQLAGSLAGSSAREVAPTDN